MKRIFLVSAIIVICMLLVACGDKPEETDWDSYTEIDYSTVDLSQYVKLGQYKALALTVPPVSINMNAIDEALQKLVDDETTFEEYETPVTDRITEAGDYVEIDFDVYFDGQLYEAGGAKGVALLLDDNNGFFEWLDDDLYGVMPGTTVETVGVMPEDGYYGSFAGKEGKFVITLVSIKAHYNIPELTDAFVAERTEFSTVDAYRQAMYDDMYAEAEKTLEDQKISAVWTAIKENAEIVEYPEQQVMYYYASYRKNIQTEADKYGHAYEEHLEAIGLTDEDVMNRAKDLVLDELVLYAIVEAEDYSVNDEDYAKYIVKYAEEQGISVEEMEKRYEREYIIDNMLWDKVLFTLTEQTEFTFE